MPLTDHIAQPDGSCSCGKGKAFHHVTPGNAKQNHEDVAMLFCACTLCGYGRFLRRGEIPQSGLASSTCDTCGSLMSFDVSLIPRTQSPASKTCSPDGTAYVYWVESKGIGKNILPTRRLGDPVSATTPFSHIEQSRKMLDELLAYARSIGIDPDERDQTGHSLNEKIRETLKELIDNERARLTPNPFR